MFASLFRPRAIIGALPVTLTNGTVADATQVMADLNWIVAQVNANAAAAATAARTDANNNFTAVQSGVAATAPANFPIASQVQNQVFNTLSSTLGTNAITARVSALAITGYVTGQAFTFVPSQTNTGPANITIDAAGSGIIFSAGSTLVGGELRAGVPASLLFDGTKFNIISQSQQKASFYTSFLGANVSLNNTGLYFDGPSVAQGSAGTWFVSGTVTVIDPTNAGTYQAKLWDGTNIIASTSVATTTAAFQLTIALSGIISNPSGNLRISVQESSQTTGLMAANQSGNGRDCSITAVRIR